MIFSSKSEGEISYGSSVIVSVVVASSSSGSLTKLRERENVPPRLSVPSVRCSTYVLAVPFLLINGNNFTALQFLIS